MADDWIIKESLFISMLEKKADVDPGLYIPYAKGNAFL